MKANGLKLIFILLCLITLIIPPAQSHAGAMKGPRLPSLAEIKKREPSFAELTAAAFAGQGVDTQAMVDWQSALKKSALLPKLYVGFDHQNKSGESLSVNDNISISSGIITIGPEDNDTDSNSDLSNIVRVRAVWDLQNLVFHPQQVGVAKFRADLFKLRRSLTDEMYKIFEQRYAFLLQYLQSPSRRSAKAKQFYLKYALLTDRLDELTQGQFHKQFWRLEHESD